MSVLNDFYFGNITPGERDDPPAPAYRNTQDRIAALEEELLASLPEEALHRFRQYSNEVVKLNALTDREAFLYGFRLGSRMMAEIFLP